MWTGALREGVIVEDRYRLEERLGGGVTAAVWRAHDLIERRPVALKLLNARYRVDPKVRDRLRREARLLLAFDHPNLARAYRVRLEHDHPYVVLELIQGRTLESELADRADQDRHFSFDELLQLTGKVVAGVAYAHTRGVVHRDLKPSNVMIAESDVKILDFGIAKILENASELTGLTTRGRFLGSNFYIAPEQGTARSVDSRADVFSLGVVIFEMLTLRRAWAKNDRGRPVRAFAEPVLANAYNAPEALLERMFSESRPTPTHCRPDLPPAVDRVLVRALAVNPKDRHQSALEMFADLAQALRSLTGDAAGLIQEGFDPAEAQTLAAEAPVIGTKMKTSASDPHPTATLERVAAGGGFYPDPAPETEFDVVPVSVRVQTVSAALSKEWVDAEQERETVPARSVSSSDVVARTRLLPPANSEVRSLQRRASTQKPVPRSRRGPVLLVWALLLGVGLGLLVVGIDWGF